VGPIEGQLTKVRRTVEDVARSREGKLAVGAATAAAAAAVAARRRRDESKEDDALARARRYRLRPDEPVGRGVRRVACGRIDDAIDLLRDSDVDAATAVHEARKDMKKLRSSLRLVRPVIGESVYQRSNERFREAARLLSEARDAEVLSEAVDELAQRFADDPPPGGWDGVRGRLVPEVNVHELDRLREQAAKTIEAGRRDIETLSLPGEPADVLRPGLKRAYGRGRRRLGEAADDPADERLHELRKRVKDLWYHLRLLRDFKRKRIEPLEVRADELSDLLGDDHDLVVLSGRLDSLEAGQRGHVERLIAGRRQELQLEAFACAKRLYGPKPKAFAERMTAPWKAAPQSR
jgi:CHAD domain-containing protein